jgi:glycoprotein-N-acetylgalactosamine 3-beta-galactosyltransferase
MPSHYNTKAKAVYETWGKRCDRILFVSTPSNISTNLPVVTFPNITEESRDILTNKTMNAFAYIYDNHFDESEWFLKADDDTFVIMENLRLILKGYHPQALYYNGIQMGSEKHGDSWFSGGGGYILSKASLRLYMTKGRYNETLCPWHKAEDVYLGRCLETLGVTHDGRPGLDMYWHNVKRYAKGKTHQFRKRYTGISFHYNEPQDIYAYEWLIHNLQVSS